MEEKLKSILNRTPWSLLIKSGVFGLGWLILPFWLFLALAFYFYLVPFFQPFKLAVPFLITLAAAAVVPYNFWFAVFLGGLFFLLLGIKNLILVERFDNHQTMVFLILFLIFFGFFRHFDNWQKIGTSFLSLGVALSFFFLFGELAEYTGEGSRRRRMFVSGLGSFLIWQAAMAVLFLPLNYFYQTALLFLCSVILADLLLSYLYGRLLRDKILADFSVFLAAAAVILASAGWNL